VIAGILGWVFAPAPAVACTMVAYDADPGLAGALAGPEAVFSTSTGGELLDAEENVVETERTALTIDGQLLELLTPIAPLAPGDYWVECQRPGGNCDTTIADGEGDPGVPPEAPVVQLVETRIPSGRNANCGPRVGAVQLVAESEAVGVIYGSDPIGDLAGAELLGAASAATDDLTWTTTDDLGEVWAAAIDAEGEISEWSGPYEVIVPAGCGCSSSGAPPGAALLLLVVVASRRRSSSVGGAL
jgi:MYXO-CTERM domain-containing protein